MIGDGASLRLVRVSGTSGRGRSYFDRNGWALIIVLSFPVGPMLYVLYAQGPRRYE
jgi:hypothetical protein